MPITLSINAIRNLEKVGTDDVLKVSRRAGGTFKVVYLNREENIKHVATMNDWSCVLRHVETSLALLGADRVPFDHVQVTLPAHPAVVLSVEDLRDASTRAFLLRGIKDVLRNWPTRPLDDPLSAHE